MKKILLKIYYFAALRKPEIEKNQEIIREVEWESIKKHIKYNSIFLDVGCGTGFSMRKAKDEFNCNSYGIDPDPGGHGVGRYSSNSTHGLNIKKGFAEKIDFQDNSFDVVYCSHVLEHVNEEEASLREMYRVLKADGVLIIGMPTADMAWLNFYSEFFFNTHQRLFNFIFGRVPFINTSKTPFINVFLPFSHSSPKAKTILYDLKHYKVDNWKKIISNVFNIKNIILPAYYPYPQYWQIFKLKKKYKKSSSVFFICNKNT